MRLGPRKNFDRDDTHMSIIRRIARWACNLKLSDVPQRVIDICRTQMLSVLASIYAGSLSAPGKAVMRAVRSYSEPGPCTCFALEEKTSPLWALLHNTSLSMALDYDDYMFLGHTGHSAVLVPLTLGELFNTGATEVLKAQIVANEIGGRLGASVVLGPHNGQMWTYIHSVCAAIASCLILGLDDEKTANAMGIALSEPPYPLLPGFISNESKTVCASLPVISGVMSALIASGGLRGPVEILECGGGFWEKFSYVPLPQMMTGLGNSWVTDTLAVKSHPGCAYTTACVEAALGLLAEIQEKTGRKLFPSEIEEIQVKAGLLTLLMDDTSRKYATFEDLTPPAINFSVGKSVALALVCGELSGLQFEEGFIDKNREEILKTAARVRLVNDPNITLNFIREIDNGIEISRILPHLRKARIRNLASLAREHLSSGRSSGLLTIKNAIPRSLNQNWWFILQLVASFLFGKAGNYELNSDRLRNLKFPFGSEVVFRLRDGSSYSNRVLTPSGAPGSIKGRKDVTEAKFLKESRVFLDEEKARAVLRAIQKLESMKVVDFIAIASARDAR